MSKKENTTEAPQQEEKIVTRYDRRMQKRKEQDEKRKKEQKITAAIGIVILAAVAALIISFPIRTFVALNQTFVEVGGEKVSKVQFDYYYNTAFNNYYTQNATYLSYFGINLSGDLSQMMYSDTLTWEDFFQKTAVSNIQTIKSLKQEAEAAGFSYDVDAEYETYLQNLKDAAAQQGVSVNTFIKNTYGSYATADRLEACVRDSIYASAYLNQYVDGIDPSDDEINAYYEENKQLYDSVDYRVIQVDAQLPTEPTELADPQPEESGEASAENGESGTEPAEDAEEEEYEPSEAEIEAAMKEAREQAEEEEKNIAQNAELTEGGNFSSINFQYENWLLDEARVANETTIVEDTTNHCYYVVQFVKRYREETPSVKARIITVLTQEALDTVKSAWAGGEATEERFIELYNEYSEDTDGVEDGLYDGLLKEIVEQVDQGMTDWLFAEERAEGDVTDIALEDGSNYFFIYYIGNGQPEWYLSIRNTLIQNAQNEYLEQLAENCEVVDKKGNLRYLTVESSSAEESTEGTEGTESTEASDTSDAVAGE